MTEKQKAVLAVAERMSHYIYQGCGETGDETTTDAEPRILDDFVEAVRAMLQAGEGVL